MKTFFIAILVFFITITIKTKQSEKQINDIKYQYSKQVDSLKLVNKVYKDSLSGWMSVTLTKYNAHPSQGWKSGLITNSGDTINLNKLNKYQLKWIALSHDLLKYFKFNDVIYIASKNNKISGYYIVKDKMNKRWKNKLDLLVPFNDTLNITVSTINIKKV